MIVRKAKTIMIKSLRVLFPALWGEKLISSIPVEYPAFERSKKVEHSARGALGIFVRVYQVNTHNYNMIWQNFPGQKITPMASDNRSLSRCL